MNDGMSAIGTKRTQDSALHMSAFGSKADKRKCLLLAAKRTCLFALQMSAYDPKRTSAIHLAHHLRWLEQLRNVTARGYLAL
jgi:hypothetical protein